MCTCMVVLKCTNQPSLLHEAHYWVQESNLFNTNLLPKNPLILPSSASLIGKPLYYCIYAVSDWVQTVQYCCQLLFIAFKVILHIYFYLVALDHSEGRNIDMEKLNKQYVGSIPLQFIYSHFHFALY